jgi:hypothetical protein
MFSFKSATVQKKEKETDEYCYLDYALFIHAYILLFKVFLGFSDPQRSKIAISNKTAT